MADPFNPGTELDIASLPEGEQQAIDALFAPSGITSEQEVDSLFSAPPTNLAQAQNLIALRDNPQSTDLIGGLATRFKEKKLPFNTQAWEDVQNNVRNYSIESNQKILDAEKKGDWGELTKLALLGVGKTLGAYLQGGLGITNEEAEATQQSFAARNYVGTISDPAQAAKALELGGFYEDELTSGKSIVPKDEKPGMAFGKGPLTAKLGMNLAMAENYLRDLESDRTKKLGSASLRNFSIQSGDAFLPFVSIGDIIVDENNPDQVARRAALSNAINNTIQKDYMTGTLAGAAIGSVGSFISVGSAATKLLGKAGKIADQAIKVPTVYSRGATYATIGASQSFEGDPRNLSVAQRLSSIFSESAVLGLAEGAGNKLENSIDNALANHAAAKALATKIPALAPLVGSTGRVVGTTLGETASEEIEAILRGQDPVEPLLQNLAVSGGIGLGMAIPGVAGAASIAVRRAKIFGLADDRLAQSLEKTVSQIKVDPNFNDQQKMDQLTQLRQSLPSQKSQALFDAVNVRSSLDPVTTPETTKVADEAIVSAKQGSVESMLSAKLTEAEGQIGTPATIETRAPLTEEEGASALNEVINAFDKGETSIDLSNTPDNASKIQWLEGQGRVIGNLSEDGKTYSVTNVKTDAGNWFRGTPPIEFEQDLKDAFVMQAEEAVDDVDVEEGQSKPKRFTREDLDAMGIALEKAGTLDEIDDVVGLYLTPDESQTARETLANKLNESVDTEKQAQRDSKLLQDRINGLEKQIKELPSDEAAPLIDLVNQLKQRQDAITNQRTLVGEQSVTSLAKQYEEEASVDSKSGKLAKELEEYPDILPAILNERNKSNQEFNKLPPDPRENEKTALSEVFNLKNPSTVDLLESLGALDENGRELKTPAETLLAYVERKKSYLNGKSLAGYRRYDISDLVSAATLNSFLYELRRGKSNLSLSVIFNSRLRDFIRRAVPRMRAGVGQGAAISLETPGLRANAVDAETLAEEQGINPNLAEVVNESLDQLAASEIENQLKNPSDVPSQPQRQEALSILGQNMLAPFRESLKSEAEKIAFDSVVENKPITEQDIIRSNLDAEKFAALKLVVRKNFGQALEAEYRKNQLAGTLPFREVAEPEGVIKAGNLTGQQIKPYEEKFLSLQENSVLNDLEIEDAKDLLDNVRNTRSATMLRAFDNYLNEVVQEKTSPAGIAEIADFIDNELDIAVELGKMSQEQSDDFIAKIAELSKPYQELLSSPESEQKTKDILNYRSNLLRVGEEVERIKEGKNEQPIAEQKVETPVIKRERVSKEFPAKESERAAPAKRVSQETVPVKREEVGRTVASKTAGAGRPRIARDRGTPVEAKFISAKNQRDFKQQDLVTILTPLGKQVTDALNENQKQNTAAGIMAIENSKHNAFYLADGPGTAKTRPLLAIGKSQLDKPNSQVIYLTLADAVTPNWDEGTIGGSIQKDAKAMGIPITARGPKGENGLGKPIEKTPGQILVTTYSSYPAENLQEVLGIVDKDTTVIMDEYHAGRNLFKKSGDTAFGQLMDEISKKAGKVVMASGTPFETPDQLLPLGRLGIFDTESPEALFSRLGYKKDYKITSTGKKSKKLSWVKLDGLTDEQVFNRINEYFESGLIKDGLFRSKRLSLEGVKINFKKIKLDDDVIKKLDDVKSMYGGAQNTEPNVLQALADTQRKILEEYKATNVVAPLVIDSVRRGRKAIVYVGFVDSKGDTTNTSAKLLEEALLKINPNLKIAKMYSKSGETKEEALLSFNENGAEVIILSKEMGGTGLELDDQFGDEPRDMYLLSTPASAIQTVQVIYRARRLNSASYPTITFIESDAQVDQATISKMREKLGVLGATVEAGFEGLKGKIEKTTTTKPTEVVAPLRSDVVATPDQVSKVYEELKSILGKNFDGEKVTLKDSKNKEHIYNVKVTPESANVFAYQMGSDDDSDFISINPVRLAKMKASMSPEQFRQYVLRAIYIHETAHADTATIFRERGENPFDEVRAIGQEFSNDYSLAVSRFYWSLLGSDINNPGVQAKIIAFAKDPYLVAMEAIRIHSELAAGFGVTEDIFALSPESRKLALSRLDDLLSLEKKDQSKLIKWFKTLVTVMQQKLGMIPSAKDRIVMKPYVEEAVAHLKQVTSSLQKQGKIPSVPSPEVNLSPASPRPSNTFDSYDLRIYRMIENHLAGKTDTVLGVTAADDMFKTVGVEEWLDALDIYTRRKNITQQERTIFRDATRATMDGQRVSLLQMANKALEIAENLEATGKSIPVEALVSTSAPAEVTSTKQNYVAEPTYQEYRVQIPGQASIKTTASSEAKAVSNAAIRLFEQQEVVNYNGERYTNPGALISALRDTGYAKFAKATSPAPEVTTAKPIALSVSLDGAPTSIPVPSPEVASVAPAPAPEIRESRAVKSLATKAINALPEGAVKDLIANAWYEAIPREQHYIDAREYINSQDNQQKVIADFLGGNIKGPLPLQGAVGFELVKSLGPKAKTDLFAKKQLVDVMLVLSKRYGTEAGQTIDLWNSLNELSDNPEAMKMLVNKQVDTSIKGRLKGYAEEENEIASGLKDATRRATEKLITGSSSKNILEKISKLVDLNKRGATLAKIDAVLAEYIESEQAFADGKEFLGADLAGAPEVEGSDADNIRLDPKQTKALSRMIIQIIERSENPSVTAASEEQIKALLLMTRAFQDAKNPDDVRRKLDIYLTAALSNALETYTSKLIGDARAREGIEPPVTRGEANRRIEKAKAKVNSEAPVSIEQGIGDGSIDHALLDAAADKLQKQAEGLQKEPKVKEPIEVFVSRIKSYIATNTKVEGGLQPAYKPLPKPTEAEVFKDLVANHPKTMEVFYGIRDSLKDNYSQEELIGLEPFIEEMFKSPYTESSLKKTIRSLESIGGPKTNIQGLIRASKGDIMTFENELGALLIQNTTLDSAQQKEVKDFLREKLASLIASERKQELERIRKRFEAKKERKTRKMRSGLVKLIEAGNLGFLTDPEVFMLIHSQLGLPMLKESEREQLNSLIEALPLYPAGMIRSKKISEMYQYIKLVSPQVWGELLVNYQTSNLLAAAGTIGVNAWSAFVSNELNGAILAGVGVTKGLAGNKARAKAYVDGAVALNAAIFAGEKPALTAAQNVFFNGDYSNIQDALTQELGGVNIWEAIVKQGEDYRAGKPGTAKPELPVNVFGEEYRIPLDSKYLSSKYGALAPFIFFGRAMAAGDAINKISSRKMYEMAEATNMAISKGLKTTEEIDLEVARLLNQSPEARKRAEAKAESEAKEFNLTPGQQSLRVEEILEQGRPDEEEVKNLIEKSGRFAAQTTFTNDFEGWFGLLADGLTTMASKAWPLRLVIKFLRTGSSLANEIMNFMPLISNARMYFGVGAGLGDTKYYRPPAAPGTVEHDLLLGKMMLGYIITGTILTALKDAMSGEDDPYFNLHFKGPSDPAQREAFFAANGKLRSMQFGRFKDGKPIFVSFEGLPVGLSGPLLLSAAINETVRYDKRSKAESIILGGLTGAALAMYGVMDIAALSGIRQIMSLTSPGVGQRDAKGIITNLTKTVGNVAGGLIPGYASLRDIEQLFDGIMGAPSGRPYQENLLSTFAQSIPFASKVGKKDLDFLGGNNKTQLANTVPFIRRLITAGVDSKDYDGGNRSPQAVHDKLISIFAANRTALDWGAGPLKDFAMMELMKDKQSKGEPVSIDDFYRLKRELTTEEQYEWLGRAGPIIQEQLASIIPDLEKMSRVEFATIVPQIVNPIKKAILYQVLLEKNQEGILFPERATVD